MTVDTEVMPEAEKAPAISAKMRQMMDHPGFMEFLGSHPDAENEIDMENEEKIGKTYEAFLTKEKVSKEIKSLYSKEIKDSIGVELSSDDLKDIDAHLNEVAISDPEQIELMQEKILLFKEIPGQIAELNKEMAKYGTLEGVTEMNQAALGERESLEKALPYSGLFGKIRTSALFAKVALYSVGNALNFDKEVIPELPADAAVDQYNEARLAKAIAVEKWGKGFRHNRKNIREEISNQIQKTQDAIEALTTLNERKEQTAKMYGALRTDLLEGISKVGNIGRIVQEKSKAKLNALMYSNDLKQLEKSREVWEKMRSVVDSGELGVDPLNQMDINVAEENIDKNLEVKISEEIMTNLCNANLGKNSFTRLEKTLAPFMTKEKIGSKSPQEVKEFIIHSLEEASQNLGTTTEDIAKRLMVKKLVASLKTK